MRQLNVHIFSAFISGLLEVVALVPYVRDVIRGYSKPNAVSFGIWTILSGIAAFAQLRSGPSWSIVMVGMLTLGMALITILALSGYGHQSYNTLNGFCVLMAVAAICAWRVSRSITSTIEFAIVGDCAALLPTIVKTCREPGTEHAGAWGLIALAAVFGALSAEKADFANLVFPLYVAAGNGAVFLLAYLGQLRAQVPRPN